MRKNIQIIVITFFFIISCKEKTVKNVLPVLVEADSAIIMYYHVKGNPRFFNMKKVIGKNPLPLINADANNSIIEAKNNCITEGKIYFYGKVGAVETIYFSRDPDCMTLSFIKTGEKYFTKMNKATKALLDSLEKNVIILPGRKE